MSIKLTAALGGILTDVKPGNGIWKVTVGANTVYKSYDPVFGNNSLAKIKQACQNNEIPSSWHIGDEKTITYTYQGNSYTDYIVLVDKTEGRYVYDSDSSYTHATFMILPSRQDTNLTGGLNGTNNKKYSANTGLLGAVTDLENRYNITSSDGTNLTLLLETIKIKSMTGSGSTVEDFACKLFIPSSYELAYYTYTNNTTLSYKTGSTLGNFELFINRPISPSGGLSLNNYDDIFSTNGYKQSGQGPTGLWSRDYGGSSNRYAFYNRSDVGYNKTGSSAKSCSDVVCFSW